eukprot:scaffold22413_cov62-Phaeocystis_antarctica.AAC.1
MAKQPNPNPNPYPNPSRRPSPSPDPTLEQASQRARRSCSRSVPTRGTRSTASCCRRLLTLPRAANSNPNSNPNANPVECVPNPNRELPPQ